MTANIKNIQLDPVTKKNMDLWLDGHYDAETKKTIQRMLVENPKEIVDAFYTNLTFGTAGLRGIMGVGCNRMNVYTVRAATQGLANYLNKQPASSGEHSVFIGYDSRHNSQVFSEEAAKVLAANGIRVYLCKELRPTPLVSFGCRYKHCTAAIMVTASHNPAQYNGYKVYWNDGGQVLPPHDKGIMEEFNAITDVTMVKSADSLSNPLIELVGKEIDDAYLKAITPLQNYPKENKDFGNTLKVVYTSLHGTGITLMPQALNLWGFTNQTLVKNQVVPDGDFPTVASPNPEERSALKLGIETLLEVNGDLLIASDPDADRVAVAINHNHEVQTLNGNQIASLCLHHICEALSSHQALPERAAFIKSIVTTELFQTIVDSYGRTCFNVLPGFKYIAEKIREWEVEPNGYRYVFGGEESYGYLLGTQTRDKDAILSGVLLCEIALHAKRHGKTLIDLMNEIYIKYGVYEEKLLSVSFEDSKEGKEQMVKSMVRLRSDPPKAFSGVTVTAIEDYQSSVRIDLKTGVKKPLTLPKTDFLLFWLVDGSKVMIRPSGTEPKIKLYCGVFNKEFCKQGISVANAMKECQKRADGYLAALRGMMM